MKFSKLNGVSGAQGSLIAHFFSRGTAQIFTFFCLWSALALCPMAQGVEVTQTMIPAHPQTGDTVQVEVEVSAYAAINGFTTVLHFNALGYDISNVSGTLYDSWLGAPQDVELTIEQAGDSVTITATRPDANTQMGSGKVLQLDGIVIIDDLHCKRSGMQASAFEGLFHAHPPITAGPNPVSGNVFLQTHGQQLTKVEVHTLNGSAYPLPATQELPVDQLPKGVFFLRVETESGEVAKLKMMRQN